MRQCCVNVAVRFSAGGQSLQDVAAKLRQGAEQPSDLPMIGTVKHSQEVVLTKVSETVVLRKGQCGGGGFSGPLSRLGGANRLFFAWFLRMVYWFEAGDQRAQRSGGCSSTAGTYLSVVVVVRDEVGGVWGGACVWEGGTR